MEGLQTEKELIFQKKIFGHIPLGTLVGWCILPLGLIWLEAAVKIHAFGTPFTGGMMRTALFSVPIGALCLLLCQVWSEKNRWWVVAAELSLLTLICMGQTVYFTIFQTFASLYSLTGFGAAVTGFSSALFGGIWTALPLLLLEAVPIGFLVVFRKHIDFSLPRRGAAFLLVGACACQVCAVVWTLFSDSGAVSPRYVYAESFILDKAVDEFGVMTTLRLDGRQLRGDYALSTAPEPVLDIQVDVPEQEELKQPEKEQVSGGAQEDGATMSPEVPEETLPEPAPVYRDQVLSIDFAALAETTGDAKLKDMHTYFASVEPTKQNEYTGLFAGKNMIMITAEAFCSYGIDPELTPTLYQLANSGFICENFYNPLWWVSTYDGEYVNLTSLLPKNGVWSLYRSAKNSLPFCLGNQFRALEYDSLAYHNHTYNYYKRDISHPHLGYDYKGIGNGLVLPFNGWPRSDLEMMEATVPEYSANEEPFHVYYLTVSGHLEYNFMGNSMARKNKELVEDLPWSEACQAYLATQIELDRALESLLSQLEAAGVLEDTVIALAGDHYPYGLSHEAISEFLGHPVDPDFELFESTLILWNSEMEEPVHIEKVCSSLDILPTISNLFGLPYDSRLMMGRDILSDSPGLVVLSNRSWITELGRYNTATEEFTPAEGAEVPEGYERQIMEQVNDMFTYSSRILEQDYYGKLGLTDGWQTAYVEDAAADAASPAA